jgi:hypothetical protein
MGFYDDFNDDLKYKSIIYDELNEWFLEKNEENPKFFICW